jgi:hypothetical protein
MQDETPPHQPIQGVCWYDILANQQYMQEFVYIDCSIEDRADFIVNEDGVYDDNNCE